MSLSYFFFLLYMQLQFDIHLQFAGNCMQYNQIFNSHLNNNSQSTYKQAGTNLSKGQTSTNNAGKEPINNIFSRNVSTNPLNSNSPANQGPTGNNNQQQCGPLGLDFSLTPANNSLVSNIFRSEGTSTPYSNSFNKSPTKSFDIFGGNNFQQTTGFSSNTTQNNKSNINIFTNNSNSNTVNNFPNPFNNPQNHKNVAPTYTNNLSPTTNVFNSQNMQKPPNTITSTSPTNNAYNHIFNKGSVSPLKNPFVSANNTFNNTQSFGINPQSSVSNPFNSQINSSNPQSNISFQNQNQNQIENQFQNQNNYQFQNQNQFQNKIPQPFNVKDNSNTQAVPQLQLQNLMKGMSISDFKLWNNPYNLYHSQLMVQHLLENINKNASQGQYSTLKQFSVLVKDSPFKNHILIKLSEMLEAQEHMKNQWQNTIKLNAQADELTQILISKIAAAKIALIQKIKVEKTIKCIQSQLRLIEGQSFHFLKPLMQAYEMKRQITFSDPDSFCIEIAKNIQSKITMIQGNIKKVFAESIQASNLITTLDQQNDSASKKKIIQLLAYFQEVCMRFQALKDKYESFEFNLPESKANQTDIENQSPGQANHTSLIKTILSKRASKIDQALLKK